MGANHNNKSSLQIISTLTETYFMEQMDWIIFCAVIRLVRTHGQAKFRFNPLTARSNPFTAALKLAYLAKIQTIQKIFTDYSQ